MRLGPARRIGNDASSVELQYDLARAALAAGDHEAAREALTRVVEAGPDRVFAPLQYVRSLALLASLEEQSGRGARAKRLLERYLGYWQGGQIDGDDVARAGRRLAQLAALPAA